MKPEFMRGPECRASIPIPEDLTEVGCAECLWIPLDIVKGIIREFDQLDTIRPATREAAKHSLAYQAVGAVRTLADLGFIATRDVSVWIRQIYDRAGIKWEIVQASTSSYIEVEAIEEEADEGDQ